MRDLVRRGFQAGSQNQSGELSRQLQLTETPGHEHGRAFSYPIATKGLRRFRRPPRVLCFAVRIPHTDCNRGRLRLPVENLAPNSLTLC